MAAMPRTDSRLRAALLVFVAVIAALALFAYMTQTKRLAAPNPPGDERLVWIGDKTVVVNPEQLGRAMTEWFDKSREPTFAFELSELSFEPQSAELSPLGAERVSQIVQLMDWHPNVAANIDIPTYLTPLPGLELNQQRAAQLQKAITDLGVDPARVAVETEKEGMLTAKSSQLVISLWK